MCRQFISLVLVEDITCRRFIDSMLVAYMPSCELLKNSIACKASHSSIACPILLATEALQPINHIIML